MKRNPLWPVLMVLVMASLVAAVAQCIHSDPVPRPKIIEADLIYCWTDDGRFVEACELRSTRIARSSRQTETSR